MSSRGRSTKCNYAGGRKRDTNNGATDSVLSGATDGGVKVVVTDVTVEPEASFPGHSCRVCRGEDDEEMVRCDTCIKWFHFTCVGVTQAIENVPWSCTECGNPTQGGDKLPNPVSTASLHGSTKKKTTVPADSNAPTYLQPSNGVSNPAKPKQTKIKHPPNLQVQEVGEHLQQHVDNIVSPRNRKPNSASSCASSRVSNKSVHSAAKLKLQKLEEERLLDEKRLEQERLYLEEKYRLLELMRSDEGSDVNSQSDVVSSWIPRAESSHNSQRQERPAIRESNHPPANLPASQRSIAYKGSHRSVHRDFLQSAVTSPLDDRSCSEFHETPRHASHQTERDEGCLLLTKQQLAARQAVSKDLPQFSGNPEDWPLFIATFNNTTAMCGFTNGENIYRLQKSLKGRAFEAVKSRLVHPANVPGVLRTLKMMFGQPEAIVHTLIEKIHALPAIREDKLETLVDFAVSVENFCATVDACGLDEYLYNATLLHQLVSKLPSTIKLNWAQYKITLPGANLAAFSTWMYSLAEAASTVTIPSIVASRPVRNESRSVKKGNAFVNAHSENAPSELRSTKRPSGKGPSFNGECLVCKGTCRTVDKCKRFLEFSRDSRWATVREFGLCRRCLSRHYGDCRAKLCGKYGCQFKHHSLLHNDQGQPSQATPTTQSSSASAFPLTNGREPPKVAPGPTTHSCHTHQTKSSDILFRYLPVVLHGKHRSVRTHAFLDEGSDLTLLDEEIANELELEGETQSLRLHWTGGTQRQEKKSRIVELSIAGVHKGANSFSISGVRTVHELLLPHQTMNIEELTTMYPHLTGLPIESYHNVRPRVLIGLKNQHLTLALKCREGKPNDPVALKTRLGWTVCGGRTTEATASPVHSVYHIGSCEDQCPTDENLHQVVKAYFALDSLGITKSSEAPISVDDQRAQILLQSLTKFTGERYETGLLWRYDAIRLPDSRAMALRRFQCLERRMKKDKVLAETLREKMTDYLSKGYARRLSDEELVQPLQRVWYLPVFPVTNPNKPGKVRMVWDAAAKAFGVSLNAALLKGPDHLSSLFTILIRFREHPIALTGDIREMFHQVLIRSEDQHCQRFYWRDDDGKIAVYVMCVMTFGACCSPSSAQYAMNQNAQRFAQKYPVAVEAIKEQHYVDDMLVSVNTVEEAIKLAGDVKFVHSQGGFEIRNWTSNSQRVLEALRGSHAEEKNMDLAPELGIEKVLGMWWCTAEDIFTYKISWNRHDSDLWRGHRRPTKREVLRVLMTIFDPLGLIAPFLMFLKVLLQEIWRSGIQWDDKIDDNAFVKWCSWLRVLPQVENVQLPRSYCSQSSPEYDDVQLHTFVDASENAMAAACYLRLLRNGHVWCRLVAAKTRVAPLKYHSIPRLELMAAVIGTRLSKAVVNSLSNIPSKQCYHTDSRDVICWINSDHRRYTPFVASRVSEILDATDQNQWRWVPSKQNVADDGTKWEKLPDLTSASRWFIGPEFLQHSEASWPKQSTNVSRTDTELRACLLTHFITPDPPINVSSWKRMIKIAALVHRFPVNCRLKKQKEPRILGYPSTE